MLSIRFSRIGKKNSPLFRLIVVDKQKDPWGTNLEILGNYNPRSKDAQINIDRLKYWLSKGAQCSDSIHNLLVNNKIIEGKKRTISTISKKRQEKLKAKDKK